jgi:hypothetical protein
MAIKVTGVTVIDDNRDADVQNLTATSVQLTGGTGDQGTLTWNADEETLDLVQDGATLQIGQEIHVHVRNNTGSTIPDGTVVMASGTLGASGRITVAPFVADGNTDVKYMLGITTEAIAAGADGKVTTFGKIRGLDTSGYSEGTVLYVSTTTAGALTATEPTSPAMSVPVAFVINSHSNNGTVFVRVHPEDENEVTRAVNDAVANLVAQSPNTLDTLNELAAALGDDPNFATTVTNALANKVDKIDITGATVGSASQVPVITYNSQGQITSATTTSVAGVSDFSYNSATNTLNISTADGGSYDADISAIGGSLAGTLADTKIQYGANYSGTPQQGSFFFDSLNQKMKVYTGTEFVDAVPASTGGGGGGETTDAVATFEKYTYNISSTTNALSGSDANGNTLSYVVDGSQNVEVYVNGVKQVEGASNDYVATTGTSVTLTYNLVAGDVVDIQVYELLTQDAFYLKSEVYTKAETNSQITTGLSSLVDTAPATLDTLNELAAALGDDPNFATTVTNSIGTKVSKSGDTMTGGLGINLYGTALNITQGLDYSVLHETGDGGTTLVLKDSKVGIGTISPSERLSVIAEDDTSAIDNGFSIYRSVGDDKVTINAQGGAAKFVADGGSNYIPYRFYGYDGTTLREDLTIAADGNVGIGTPSPVYTLVVSEDGNDNIEIGAGVIQRYNRGTQNYGAMNYYSASHNFYTTGGGQQSLFISSSGSIGIGTPSPGAKLDVDGSTKLGSRTSAGNDINTELSGMGVDSLGTRYGSYGQLKFYANSAYTGSARRWLITNAYQANKLAFITTSYTSDPEIQSGGGTNGTVALTMDGSANLNVQQSIGIRRDVPRAPVDIGSITSSMIIPVGTNGQQPSSPIAGMMRFNTDTGMGELHDGSNWNTFGGYISPYYYATATAAAADGLYSYWSCKDTSTTSSEAGTSSSASASLNGVSANSAYAGNGWDRGTAYQNQIRLDNMISGTAPTLTVAWWFVMTDSSIHSTSDGAGMFWPNTGNGGQVMIGYDGSTRVLRAGGAGWVSDGAVVINPLSTGAYHHVVCVINGSSCSYYINGQAAHTETASFDFGSSWMFSNYSNLTGGNTNNHYHRGKIDEITVWSRALSGTEVSKLYNAYADGYSLIETLGVA